MTKEREFHIYDMSMDDLKALINSCEDLEIVTVENPCSDCGGSIESHLKGTYKFTEEEKQREKDHCLKYRKSAINFIKKYLENHPDQKKDCDRVLLNKGLKIN